MLKSGESGEEESSTDLILGQSVAEDDIEAMDVSDLLAVRLAKRGMLVLLTWDSTCTSEEDVAGAKMREETKKDLNDSSRQLARPVLPSTRGRG